MEAISPLPSLYPNSVPVTNIYLNLTDESDQLGVGVLLRRAWSTHRAGRARLLDMSPQKMTDDVLGILRREIGHEGVQAGEVGNSGSTSNDYASNSGLRGGRGGDIIELVRGLARSTRRVDQGIKAIQQVIQMAEKRKINEFKELKQDQINTLIAWRNGEQTRWAAGFLAGPAQMNGHAVGPTNPQ
jgi:hypothetical protein